MSDTEDIKSPIDSFSGGDAVRFRDEFLEKRWQDWDRQIAEDSKAGKLDFLIEEVAQQKAIGTLQDL